MKTELMRAMRRAITRRDLLKGGLAGLALAKLPGCGDDTMPPPGPGPRIAIIGAGTAGLHAAYQLRMHGVDARVYEASGRTGGRMFTMGGFADGQIAELGGELVDTAHTTIMALAAHFGIALDDLHAEEQANALASDTFRMGGAVLKEADLVAAFTPVAAKMDAAVTAADADDAEFARIDALSIDQWLAQEAGLAANDVFRRLLELAYVGEYGLEVAEQSAWNLIYLMNYAMPDPFEIFGESDETYHLHAGSQSIPDALAAAVGADAIELERALAAVAPAGERFALHFETGDDVIADHVIFALPFTKLREVDLSSVPLPADKRQVIDELGYGTNAKLMLSYTSRVWRTHGAGGTAITDEGELQATWDTSRGQAGQSGLLTNFVGGARGIAIGLGTAEDRAQEIEPWVEALFPGAAAAYRASSAVRQHWPSAPFHKGSYACYKPGQWSFSGTEGTRVGRLHFCGEHTSVDFQGYMEGAAETGARAASEVLGDLEIAPTAFLRAILSAPRPRPRGPRIIRRAAGRSRSRRLRASGSR